MKFTLIAFAPLAAALLPSIEGAVDHYDARKIKEFADKLAERYPFLTASEEELAARSTGVQAAELHQFNQDVHNYFFMESPDSPDTPYVFDLTLTCQGEFRRHEKSIRSTRNRKPTTFGKLISNYQGFKAFPQSCGIRKFTYLVKLDGRQESFVSGDKLEPFVQRGVPCSITVHVVPRTETRQPRKGTKRSAVAGTNPSIPPFIFDLILMCQGQVRRHGKSIRSTTIPNPATFGRLLLNYQGFAAHGESCGIPKYTYSVKVNDGQESFVWTQELGSVVQRGVPCSITVDVVSKSERPPYIFNLILTCQHQIRLHAESIRSTAFPRTFGGLLSNYHGFATHAKSCGIPKCTYLVKVNDGQESFDLGDKLEPSVQRGVPCSITVHVLPRNGAVADTHPSIPPFVLKLSLKCYRDEDNPLIDKEKWTESQETTDLGSLVHTYPGFSETANRCEMPEHIYWIYVGDHHWYSEFTFGEHQSLEGLVSRGSPVTIMVLVMPKGSSKVDPQEIPAGFKWTND